MQWLTAMASSIAWEASFMSAFHGSVSCTSYLVDQGYEYVFLLGYHYELFPLHKEGWNLKLLCIFTDDSYKNV